MHLHALPGAAIGTVTSAALALLALSGPATAFVVSYSPIIPPSYPIAVRSPFLSAWLPGMQADNISAAVPESWVNKYELDLGIMARVGDQTYTLFSMPETPAGATSAHLRGATYTTTHTIFKIGAGNLIFTLDFFSPVSPRNLIRQSLPFSYVTVSVEGATGPVHLYVDYDEGWTGQKGWTDSRTYYSHGMAIHELWCANATLYAEKNVALWGTAVLAANDTNNDTTVLVGPKADVRATFAANGTLWSQPRPYSIGDVAAVVQTIEVSGKATFAIGHVREHSINYFGQARTGYYRSQYPNMTDALAFFMADYEAAYSESLVLDQKLYEAANKAGNFKYSDILTLSVRQCYGAMELTIPYDTRDPNDLMVFVKEISSDGNINTIDVLFPTFPIWYVMSPEYIRYALEPAMRYIKSGGWALPYMLHDLGITYPNAIGYAQNRADEAQPVEECGNVILLAYAYSTATNSLSWAQQYQPSLQQYADFLVANGTNITAQLSTDDGAGPLANQTNLAIKAAVALNAYGQMFGNETYSHIGRHYAKKLYEHRLGTDSNRTHFTLEYGQDDTYTTAFNLYPDYLFGLDTFNTAVFDMQSSYYPTVRSPGGAGVPLDSRTVWAKTDWALFAAACAGQETKEMFVDDVWAFVAESRKDNQVPFADRWVVSLQSDVGQVGASMDYRARPVVGGHFAILALEGPGSVVV